MQRPAGRRHALLAVLIVCGLRRDELVRLTVEHMQKRSRRWLIVDLPGKGKRIRTVALPSWVKEIVDAWTKAASITTERIFRAVHKSGAVQSSLSSTALWQIVQAYAGKCDLAPLSPHDLRRTCAKLCRAAGGDLEQIQFLLGHESIQTTERYLGGKQELVNAVNDRIVVSG
jgi:integrase